MVLMFDIQKGLSTALQKITLTRKISSEECGDFSSMEMLKLV